MSNISANDALSLANQYSDASDAVHKQVLIFISTNAPYNDISDLEDQRDELLLQSTDMVTKAVGMALNDIQGGLAALTEAVNDAKALIAKIKKVKDVITLAGDLISLGAAIVAKDPGGAATAIGQITKDVQNISKPPSP